MRRATPPRYPINERKCNRTVIDIQVGWKDTNVEQPQIYSKLTNVFREVFDEDDLKLTPEMTADDVDGWDSLSHIRLILAVSKSFDVKFSASEIGGLKNVGQLVDLLQKKS